VAGAPTPMPADYNAVGGQGYNPYDPRKDPREATFDGRPALQTGGSSSGIGTAANFWAGNVGTETSGSILSPSNQNMLAGIKPTVGRISRYGVIPITADQDTAGPMAKSVTDVAIMFGAMESASSDPNDPATKLCTPAPGRDYTKFLKADGLKGARIGIPRASFYDAFTPPGPPPPQPADGGRGGRGGGGGGNGGSTSPGAGGSSSGSGGSTGTGTGGEAGVATAPGIGSATSGGGAGSSPPPSTRLTKISSSELCLVCRSAYWTPASWTWRMKSTMPRDSLRVS